MKLTALAVVILALGIVVGFALAGGASGGPASAVPQCPGPSSQCPTPTPEPPQQREDQIPVTMSSPCCLQRHIIALDPGDYPIGAVFKFEAANSDPLASGTCVQLFDLTDSIGLAASEVCAPAAFKPVRVRSGGFSLSSGEHEYTVEATCGADPPTCTILATRIIVEWTE